MMTPRQAAEAFVRYFCEGDLEALALLLDDDLELVGPLHRFQSRDDYLGSLKGDAFERAPHEILEVAESDEGVAIFWVWKKAAGPLTIAQHFRFREGLIQKMLLVFDVALVGVRAQATPPKSGSELFQPDAGGRTPLHHATAANDLAEVERMIFSLAGTGMSSQRVALMDQCDLAGLTAADIAERCGYQEIEQLLRREKARIEHCE